jgi:tetratricopeptide (TPR) repeat protein
LFLFAINSALNLAAEDDLAHASEALRAGRLVEARIALEKALERNPDDANAELQLGLLLGQLGDLDAARKAFRKAITDQPASAEAHYNLGLTLVADPSGRRDWPAAIQEFREALRLRPDYIAAQHALGVGLSETGQFEAALKELRVAVASDPNSAEAHLDLGRALQGLGDLAGAEREYRSALHLKADFVDAEIALGKLLLLEKRGLPEAIQNLNRALRSNPDNLNGQYALAKALKLDGEAVPSAVAFRQAAALTARDANAIQNIRLSNAGLDAAHQGQLDNAIKYLREAVEQRPEVPLSHYNLGLVLADKGDLPAATAQVIAAISLMPLDVRFYASLGRMWKKAGDLFRARRAFERGLALDPGNTRLVQNVHELPPGGAEEPFEFGAPSDTPEAHFAFASVLGQRGDWLDSIGEWRRVLALQPANVDARNNLGVAYSHLGNDRDAELEFRKVLQVLPDSAGAHFGLAVLALQRGEKVVAAQELRQLLHIQPDYPNAQQLLSNLNQK